MAAAIACSSRGSITLGNSDNEQWTNNNGNNQLAAKKKLQLVAENCKQSTRSKIKATATGTDQKSKNQNQQVVVAVMSKNSIKNIQLAATTVET